MKLSTLLISLSVLTLCACNASAPKPIDSATPNFPIINEGVDFISDGKIKSTRCTGYTIYDGRDHGIERANADAAAAAIAAIKTEVLSQYSAHTQCKRDQSDAQCTTHNSMVEKLVSHNFLQEIQQTIIDKPNQVVCVTLIGKGGVVDETILKLSQQHTQTQKAASVQIAIPEASPIEKQQPKPLNKNSRKVSTDNNLLINGDFKSHFSNGWTLLEGKIKGIKQIKATQHGLVLSYRGKSAANTQWAISQTVPVSNNQHYVFSSQVNLQDKLTSPFSAIKLNMLDHQNKVIYSKVWTSDEYYKATHPHDVELLTENQAASLQVSLQKLWRTKLSQQQIQHIHSIQIVFDVSPPAQERCLGYQMTIKHVQIKRL